MDTMLPIGSVVELEGVKEYVTIIGLLPSLIVDGKLVFYEYVGCNYLKGYRSADDYIYFDESKITNVYFIGYALEFDFKLLENLHEVYKEIDNGGTLEETIDRVIKKLYPDDINEKQELKKKILDYCFNNEPKKEQGE